MQDEDIEKDLHKVICDSTFFYRGCRIEVVRSGFKRNGTIYTTLEDAKKDIDNSFINWNNSIKNAAALRDQI